MSKRRGGAVGGLVGAAVIAAVGLVFIGIFFVIAVPLLFKPEPEPTGSSCQVLASDDSGSASIPDEWVDDVERAADVAGLPVPVIAMQLQAESNWNPTAVSPRGAAGLAQAMPGTWTLYGDGDPFDPEASIKFQGEYMKALMQLAKPHADGDADRHVRLALAAYNWGDGNMGGNGWSLDGLPSETANYIGTILDDAQTKYADSCAAVTGQYSGDLGPGEWASPLPGGQITGAGMFGLRNVPGLPAWAQNHVGIDLATESGGQVVAPTDVRITAIYPPDGCVMMRQTGEPGFAFAVCHLNDWGVDVNDELKRGDVIGAEGTRAASVGVGVIRHLHFEMYEPGHPDPQYPGPSAPGVIDPAPILREKGAL